MQNIPTTHSGYSCCSINPSESKLAKAIAILRRPVFVIISGIAVAIAFVFHMQHNHVGMQIAWVSVILSGIPLFYVGLNNFFVKRRIRSTLLMTIAMVASIAIGEVFAAGEIAFIMAIGELLENRTVDKAKSGINKLIAMAPETARIIYEVNGQTKEKHLGLSQIKIGDIIRIKPGETIPIDGKVVRGSSSIDQSNMTGESLPVDVELSSLVYSGTQNQTGSIDIEVTRLSNESSIQRMIQLMHMAESSKAPIERLADKWATWLVPLALIIAIITYIATGNIVRAVTVLVVFCPCALALATPTTVVAAIGQATKNGVLIKNKAALEAFAKINQIAFDKTGTLTKGDLVVSDVITISKSFNESEIIKLAASLEVFSEHPLGKAIVKKADTAKLYDVESFKASTGMGIEGKINGELYKCVKPSVYENLLIDTAKDISRLSQEGKAIVMLEKENEVIALLSLSDTIKDNASAAIDELKDLGIKNILLTGDNKAVAQNIASILHIDNIMSELMPEDKVNAINSLKSNGAVAMVGDGMNDAPALKAADASIAMAQSGSDISVDAADMVIMGDDLSKLPYLKRLSQATIKTIKTNMIISLIINFVAIVLSISGVLNPVTGALVHNAGSVLVTLNGALLYKRKV